MHKKIQFHVHLHMQIKFICGKHSALMQDATGRGRTRQGGDVTTDGGNDDTGRDMGYGAWGMPLKVTEALAWLLLLLHSLMPTTATRKQVEILRYPNRFSNKYPAYVELQIDKTNEIFQLKI